MTVCVWLDHCAEEQHDGGVTWDELLRRSLPADIVTRPVPPAFRTDWFGRPGHADALVRPRSAAEVAAVLRICSGADVVVVPIGGNTGLVGGTISSDERPTVAVSLGALTGLQIDEASGTVVAGAGVTVAQLHRAAQEYGLTYGVDLASRDSATVGGTIATDAGGIHVCAYGTTRRQVLGIEAALADGSVISDLRGLPKDNTGYALQDLLIGSEGTLGVVTAARLRLHPRPHSTVVVAFPAGSLTACVELGRRLGTQLGLLACEVVDTHSWRDAATDLDLRDPIPATDEPFIGLVELDIGHRSFTAALDSVSQELDSLAFCAVAGDEADRAALWALREAQAEWWNVLAGRHAGCALHKYDVTLPLADLDEAAGQVTQALKTTPEVVSWGVFGHVFEGSLHIQLVAEPTEELDRLVLGRVSELGGSLSAEHGVGRDKAAFLGMRRTAAELATMAAVKRALDPAGILNPGVILPT